MRYLLLILLYLTSAISSSKAGDSTDFLFEEGALPTYFDTVVERRAEQPLCAYFYFDGCGACVKMEKEVFPDTGVLGFYTENFTTIKVNTETKYGEALKERYDITAHPHFLFFDREGNIVHRLVGLASPKQFIHHGKRALSPDKGLTGYHRAYQTGNRSPEFLRNYCYLLDSANRLDSNIINDYLNTQSYADLEKEKNIRFIYLFCLFPPGKHGPQPAISFDSDAYRFLREEKAKFCEYYPEDQVSARIITIAKHHARQAIEDSSRQKLEAALNIIRPYKAKSPVKCIIITVLLILDPLVYLTRTTTCLGCKNRSTKRSAGREKRRNLKTSSLSWSGINGKF